MFGPVTKVKRDDARRSSASDAMYVAPRRQVAARLSGSSLGGAPSDSQEEAEDEQEPTSVELQQYAAHLGVDVNADEELLWIVRNALCAPIPQNWEERLDESTGSTYFYNRVSGVSSWSARAALVLSCFLLMIDDLRPTGSRSSAAR